jgi:ribosome maturation factor RimP
MIKEDYIRELIAGKLEGTELFVTDLKIKPGNKIMVFIDGDQGVAIKDCVTLSRHLESNLNNDNEAFELQVSSHGAAEPFSLARQYPKHIGRDLEIQLDDVENPRQLSGTLLSADETGITLELFQEKKKKGEKIIPERKQEKIPFKEIRHAKVILSFK